NDPASNKNVSNNHEPKEKRQFLRRGQGIARFQAPPKRREKRSKSVEPDSLTRSKRPTSANSGIIASNRLSNVQQKPRSASTSSSGRQTPTQANRNSTVNQKSKAKPAPTTNRTAKTRLEQQQPEKSVQSARQTPLQPAMTIT
ncbi:unnamed protein product, partial [Didymodactylos carnosus]